MNRLLLASLSLPLVACYAGERRSTGECPAGETCSDTTPRGLDFIGNHLVNDLLLSGPRATAVGGTQVVALEYDRGDGVDVALDLPYTADDGGGLGVKVESTSGSQVTIRGAGSGKNYLRILDTDGFLMDRKELAGAALSRMELVSNDYETVSEGTLIAFAAGERELGVALYGDVQHSSGPVAERLVDTSMQLALAGSTTLAWDTLRIDAAVGSYTLDVTAGDKPANTLDVVVVDHADTVALLPSAPTTIMPNGSASVCFEAKASGRHVIGLEWTFTVDGTAIVQGANAVNRNCVGVTTTKTTGTVAVTGSAGGQTASMSLTVGAAREQLDRTTGSMPSIKPLPVAIPTAGDRASL
jgi:hypothetical protein